jgi:hypothetical protein
MRRGQSVDATKGYGRRPSFSRTISSKRVTGFLGYGFVQHDGLQK